jgi:hypothetical protein
MILALAAAVKSSKNVVENKEEALVLITTHRRFFSVFKTAPFQKNG